MLLTIAIAMFIEATRLQVQEGVASYKRKGIYFISTGTVFLGRIRTCHNKPILFLGRYQKSTQLQFI